MIGIMGLIRTESASATCVAGSLAPDNLPGMAIAADGGTVIFRIEGIALRSVTATVDDYLMNLAMAEEVCSLCRAGGLNDMTHLAG
ncbi:MAG TPA: hypothetical protein ENN52_07560 [Methanofollis liminatans]|uniref:Uncharacterized protein n=1 Tax=Methanofollis liminatans TaxID=2201 RepID=A0A831LX35_9EURY|nr:hypothetical protein [Methanofollis liminatans]